MHFKSPEHQWRYKETASHSMHRLTPALMTPTKDTEEDAPASAQPQSTAGSDATGQSAMSDTGTVDSGDRRPDSPTLPAQDLPIQQRSPTSSESLITHRSSQEIASLGSRVGLGIALPSDQQQVDFAEASSSLSEQDPGSRAATGLTQSPADQSELQRAQGGNGPPAPKNRKCLGWCC